MLLAERDENNREEGRKEERRRLIMDNYAKRKSIPYIAKFMRVSEDEIEQIIKENQVSDEN